MPTYPLAREALALLSRATELKHVDREGWKRVGITAPESVAAHSYGVALAALLLAPPELNKEKLLAMALLHDLAEIEVGDITPHDGVSREMKHAREHAAMRELLVSFPHLLALFEEAEAGNSEEARFLHALDKLDMRVTAERYAEGGFDTRAFIASARPAIARVFTEDDHGR